jgi:hypothetical protein
VNSKSVDAARIMPVRFELTNYRTRKLVFIPNCSEPLLHGRGDYVVARSPASLIHWPAYFSMESETFKATFASALREDLLVCIGIAVLVPVTLLARSWAHPGMTLPYALGAGLLGGVIFLLFYIGRFLLRAPKSLSLSPSSLVLTWRNGSETKVLWDEIEKAEMRSRWGARWRLRLPQSTVVVSGDGLSQARWNRISEIIIEQVIDRGIPCSVYDAYNRCVSEYKGNQP